MDYSAAQIMAAMSAALREGDMPAVVSLLHMLAVVDPASAALIRDAIEVLA